MVVKAEDGIVTIESDRQDLYFMAEAKLLESQSPFGKN